MRKEGPTALKDLALAVLPLTTQILRPRHLLRSKPLKVRTPGYVSGPALPRHSRAPSSRTSSGCTQPPSSRPPSLFQAQRSRRSPCDARDPSRRRPRQLPGGDADTSLHTGGLGPGTPVIRNSSAPAWLRPPPRRSSPGENLRPIGARRPQGAGLQEDSLTQARRGGRRCEGEREQVPKFPRTVRLVASLLGN